jgi:hypothetical protein
MRLPFLLLPFFAAACTVTTSPTTTDDINMENTEIPDRPPATLTAPAPTPAPEPEPEVSVDDFAEVVYVFMEDRLAGGWFCTGTLVAKDRIVTAAHCLDPEKFVHYEIVAPLAPGKPEVQGKNPRVFGGSFEDVANPDIGVLELEEPVMLPRYAELTDVVTRVENGEKLQAAAVVRIEREPEAPLSITDAMPLSSAVSLGYEQGYSTPYFSKGGDSGAGLFLVENGKPTHKLVGVARQPEPDRNLDHFTRIGAAFEQWYE